MRSFLPSTFWDLEMYSIYSPVDLTTLLGDLQWESLLSIFLPIGISWVFWIYFLLHPRKTNMEQSRFGRWLSFWKGWFLGSILLVFWGAQYISKLGTPDRQMAGICWFRIWGPHCPDVWSSTATDGEPPLIDTFNGWATVDGSEILHHLGCINPW